ncbi:MAG: DUF5667 domain-containing protein [Patescibacteria group bacterium]
MKKIIVFLLIFLIIIGAARSVALAMAGVKEIPMPKAYIAKIDGEEARIKKIDGNDYIKIAEGMEIMPGDIIKTGDNSQVIINFYDNTVSRLDSNSEIKFEKLSIDKENFAKTKINIFMSAGQIWSRIIQLMDKDASFEINSSVTVATVRGTAFDFEVISGDKLAKIDVVEGIIEVVNAETKEKINLLEGNTAVINGKKETEALVDKKIIIQPISEEKLKSKWVKDNQKLDEDFEKQGKEKAKKLNKEIAGVLPDSTMYKVKRIAEKVKIILTNNPVEKQKIIIAFANKRLSEAQQLAQEGKTALAESTINNWQKEIDESMADPETIKKQTKNQFNLQKQLTDRTTIDSGFHNLKIILEDLEIKNEPNKADKEYLELKKVEQRLKEIKFLKEKGEKDLLKGLIKKQEEILKEHEKTPYQEFINQLKLKKDLLISPQEQNRQKVDFSTSPHPTAETTQALEEKSLESLPNTIQPLVEKITEKQNQILEIINSSPNATSDAEVKIKTLTSLVVSADKYNMLAGGKKQFVAMARYNDNSTNDVTRLVSWTLAGDIGDITQSGLLQADNDGGKGIVKASFEENGIIVKGSSPEITALALEF